MANDVLNRRFREQQNALAGRVADRLAGMLGGLGDLSQAELEAYVEAAYPTVAGGQKVAAEHGAGYITALVRERMQSRTLDVAGALKRSGVAVTKESRSLVAPVLRARALVADGKALPVALDAAASYAASLSSLDLQAAQRVGLDEGARVADVTIERWVKETGPTACEWCIAVSGDSYGSAEAVPFHDNDKCSVVPELEAGVVADMGDDDIPF